MILAMPFFTAFSQPMDESGSIVKEDELQKAVLEGTLPEQLAPLVELPLGETTPVGEVHLEISSETVEVDHVEATAFETEGDGEGLGVAETEPTAVVAVPEVTLEEEVPPAGIGLEEASEEPLEEQVAEILGLKSGEPQLETTATAEVIEVAEPVQATEKTPPEKFEEKSLEEQIAEVLGSSVVELPSEESTPQKAAGVSPVDEALREAAAELQAVRMTATSVPEPELPRLQKEETPGPASVLVSSGIPDIQTLKDNEETRRRAYEQHAMELLMQGERALAAKRYTEARELFAKSRKAFAEAGHRPQTKAFRERLKQKDRECVFLQAQMALRVGDYGAAEQAAKEAAAMGHPDAPGLLKDIEKAKAKPSKPEQVEVPRWQQDDYKQKTERIAETLKRGREFFAAGEYDKAQEAFETVLRDDPQNTEALRWREKVAQTKYRATTMEVESTRADMVNQVRKAWNRRDYGVRAEVGIGEEKPVTRQASVEEMRRRKITEKMENIIIPEVDFRLANINDVISFLQEASVEYDRSGDQKRGVNIILNLRSGTGGAPGEFGAEQAGGVSEVPYVTFKARDISLLEVLKTVTEVAGLKYRIEGSVVMVIPYDAPVSKIIQRTYTVLPTVGERIGAISQEMGRTEPAFGKTLGAGVSIESDRTDWKEFFKSMGVEWPAGSQIRYIPSLGKIMVANTAENLAVFEERLRELNVVPKQVEIEARFVEVRQMDLSSLGFEWLLTDDWEVLQKKSSSGLPLGAGERIVVRGNPSTGTARGGFTSGNRFVTDGIGATLPGLSEKVSLGTVNDRVLSIAGVLTNPELALVLHMLQQQGNADLLSAPRVVTQSGMEATIKVVTTYLYPTEFSVTPIQSEINDRMVVVGGLVEPQSFEQQDVGVILSVLPTVTEDGQMISLTLAPEVISEPIWKDYGSTYQAADGSSMILPMPQPFFPRRTISTSVLIYDATTIVMGGMITEARHSFDDKIPFFGDIPIVGRLFRSKGEQSEKRNLLIFVTAQLMKPDGTPVGRSKSATTVSSATE